MHIHHRIPQDCRKLFGDEAIDNLANLVALPSKIHNGYVNGLWGSFKRAIPNPSQKQVAQFSRIVDQLTSDFANNVEAILKYK